ncbi:MAG: DUF1501 domain-containing protein [Proteobacteria bacterium]|nr:DUF1501 domain-containing protein [Pseudomonadota bacterium]
MDGNPTLTRRSLLAGTAGALGATLTPAAARASVLEHLLAASDPLAPKAPHFAPRAKQVIFLFMPGGVSHVDTFDPKPALERDHEKSRGDHVLMRSRWGFAARGESGIEISELFPHIGGQIDRACLIRSMTAQHGNHFEAVLGMHTGSTSFVRPSIGSWVSHALGTFNPNLPPFVVIAPHLPYAGEQVWGSDFLPACHQGVRLVPGDEPIPNVAPRVPTDVQERELALLQRLNERHRAGREADGELFARARAYATARGMQREAPEVFDLGRESDAVLELYGLERGKTSGFAWQCLVARRLIERGVRFVESIDVGASNNWDAHGDMKSHERLARNVDRPIAALLRDLGALGLLDETLVVWTTEFGRTPHSDKKNKKGRGHHRQAFSSWLAGAGVKPGFVYGATDEHGYDVVEGRVGIHDFHATLLHLLGLDHERLTFRHAGRDFRLTDVGGRVVEEILA